MPNIQPFELESQASTPSLQSVAEESKPEAQERRIIVSWASSEEEVARLSGEEQ